MKVGVGNVRKQRRKGVKEVKEVKEVKDEKKKSAGEKTFQWWQKTRRCGSFDDQEVKACSPKRN